MTAKVKICGLSRPEDVAAVNAARPDYCGFIINFPKSHRNVSPETVSMLTRALDPAIVPVGVFVDQPVGIVAALLNAGVIAVAQLHGREDEDYIAALRAAAGGKPVWKAFQIRAADDLARAAASSADQILLDNGAGTGRAFDWSLAGGMARPFILAGGLTPENLPEAIARLRPAAVDLSSGVETDGRKDPQKILAAVAAVRSCEL